MESATCPPPKHTHSERCNHHRRPAPRARKRKRKKSERERFEDRRRLAAMLAETLKKTQHHSDKADSVAVCHTAFALWACERDNDQCSGRPWAQPIGSCRVRLCPFEARERELRAQHRFGQVIEGLRNPKYLVLSEANCELNDLEGGLRRLYESWNRFRRSDLWAAVDGAICVLEVTYNRKARTWHPHLNVLFDGPFLPFEALRDEWINSTRGRGRSAHIQKADKSTVRELLKYVTKLVDFLDIPEAVDVFLTATHRKRFIRTYGTFYGLGLEDEGAPRGCPDCGFPERRSLGVLTSTEGLYWDEAGVIRLKVDDS